MDRRHCVLGMGVTMFSVSGCARSARSARAPRLEPAGIEPALARAVSGRATGVVLAARQGRGSVAVVQGPGDRFGAETVFDLLSIAKFITAVTALALEERGRFDLNAPLTRYLPELPDGFADVTAREALAHQAGFPANFDIGDDLTVRTAEQALAEIIALPRSDKGEYRYSNIGPGLVALAIERSERRKFQSMVRGLVFTPAGMRDTWFFGERGLTMADVAVGRIEGREMGTPAQWPQTWTMFGAAGIAGTIGDLWRLNRALVSGRLLGREALARLWAPGASTGGRGPYLHDGLSNTTYGSGLYHWTDGRGRQVHFHGGDGDFGFHSLMFYRADDDVFVAGLFNSREDGFERGALISAAADALGAA